MFLTVTFDKIKAVYPEIAKLSNDELRAKTVELKKYISDSAAEEQKKIEELKGTIETTELEDREGIFAQIDKLEKEVLEKYEKALDDVLPQAFAIVKDTARRFSENPEKILCVLRTIRRFGRTIGLLVVMTWYGAWCITMCSYSVV